MKTESSLQTAVRTKQDNLHISLRDFSIRLGVSPALLVLFFQGKKKAGYLLLHGILAAFPGEKEWEPLIIDYLRENGRESTPPAPIL